MNNSNHRHGRTRDLFRPVAHICACLNQGCDRCGRSKSPLDQQLDSIKTRIIHAIQSGKMLPLNAALEAYTNTLKTHAQKTGYNWGDREGNTPLHHVFKYKRLEMVIPLWAHGFGEHMIMSNHANQTPLQVAVDSIKDINQNPIIYRLPREFLCAFERLSAKPVAAPLPAAAPA